MSSVSRINVVTLFALYLRQYIMYDLSLIYILKVEIFCQEFSFASATARHPFTGSLAIRDLC